MNKKEKVLRYTVCVFLCLVAIFLHVVLSLRFGCAGRAFAIAFAFGTGMAIATINEEVSK